MVGQVPLLALSFACDTAIPYPGKVVVVASTVNAGNVALPAAAGVTGFMGVVDQDTAVDDAYNTVSVIMEGTALVQTTGAAAIAIGALLEIGNAAGQVQTHTANQVIGVALTAAPAVAGSWVTMRIIKTATN